MPNYRDTSAVGQDLGSSRMLLVQHDSSYALTGEAITLPVIETSNVNNAVATLSKEDEEGVTYQADGAKTITKTITIMQKDKDALKEQLKLLEKDSKDAESEEKKMTKSIEKETTTIEKNKAKIISHQLNHEKLLAFERFSNLILAAN